MTQPRKKKFGKQIFSVFTRPRDPGNNISLIENQNMATGKLRVMGGQVRRSDKMQRLLQPIICVIEIKFGELPSGTKHLILGIRLLDFN